MTAKLLFLGEREREGSVELTLGGLVIGRSQECGIHTEDPLVSRKNTKIAFSGGRWCVEDLGSSNGTFVNEVRVQRQALSEGDTIRCGGLRVRFASDVADVAAQPETLLAPPAPVTPPPDETLQADNLRLRARLAELERTQAHHRDEVQALTALGKELAAELQTFKDERGALQQRVSEQDEELQARDRQLERAHEDVERHKQEADEMRGQLAEAKKTAEEGWAQLKASDGETDKLRRVMSQQEQLLDQRRMGLSALETAVQELRAERDKLLRTQLSLANERDELRRQLELRELAFSGTLQMRGLG